MSDHDYREHQSYANDVYDDVYEVPATTYTKRELMFCHLCRIPVLGDAAVHELNRHGGAQTCWMTPDDECRRLERLRNIFG